MPFDQHYLIASIAPRKVLVGSAAEDAWAGPESEFLSCLAASSAFEKGLVHGGKVPQAPEKLLEGDLGYHVRHGKHYFSRTDWQRLMEFVNLHRCKEAEDFGGVSYGKAMGYFGTAEPQYVAKAL